jgi:hypothetical protein
MYSVEFVDYLVGGVDAPHLDHPLDLGDGQIEGGSTDHVPENNTYQVLASVPVNIPVLIQKLNTKMNSNEEISF